MAQDLDPGDIDRGYTDDSEMYTAHDYAFPDGELEDLVDLANGGMQVGISIWVGGNRISGLLCSGREYFEGTSTAVLGAMSGADGQRLAAKYSDEATLQQQAHEEAMQSEDAQPPGFIHLLSSDNRRPLYRGRLSAVDGWNLDLP